MMNYCSKPSYNYRQKTMEEEVRKMDYKYCGLSVVSCVFLANFNLACVTKLWVKKPKAAPKIAKKE